MATRQSFRRKKVVKVTKKNNAAHKKEQSEMWVIIRKGVAENRLQ